MLFCHSLMFAWVSPIAAGGPQCLSWLGSIQYPFVSLFGPHGGVWELSGAVWSLDVRLGPIVGVRDGFGCLRPSVSVWHCLGPSVAFCVCLGLSGAVCGRLGSFGSVCSRLGVSGVEFGRLECLRPPGAV